MISEEPAKNQGVLPVERVKDGILMETKEY
jgi:hypothetical protein